MTRGSHSGVNWWVVTEVSEQLSTSIFKVAQKEWCFKAYHWRKIFNRLVKETENSKMMVKNLWKALAIKNATMMIADAWKKLAK